MTAATATSAPAEDLVAAYCLQLEGRSILLFDGVCGLCNRTVRFLIRRDTNAVLRFVPLESPLAQQLLARFAVLEGPEGIVFIAHALTTSERLSRRSEAFCDALELLPSPWPAVARAIRLVPRPLRELVYGWIARHRYRLFGRYQTCPIPSPEQRARIMGVPQL